MLCASVTMTHLPFLLLIYRHVMTHVMVCASRGVDTHPNIQSGHEQRHTISFQAISQKKQQRNHLALLFLLIYKRLAMQ